MAINNMPGMSGLGSTKPTEGLQKPAAGSNAPGNSGAIDFRNALDEALQPPAGVTTDTKLGQIRAQMPNAATSASSLKFSNHSIERMHSRGITYSPEQMKSIENAVSKAAAKGSKDTLVLTDNSALIVSVKNSTVVTVMDRQAMKENVFTNIDSTVMA